MRRPVAAAPGQRGLTLIELLLATAVGAILLAGINGLVKLGLDAQAAGRSANELAYQGRFALERMAERARATRPKELSTPAANTTGNWFAPVGCVGAACVMYCRNGASQLIETTTADFACAGANVIADKVSVFAATLPADGGPLDRHLGVLSLTLDDGKSRLVLTSSLRLGGGTQ